MKKGINEEYDKVKKELFELRVQINLLRNDNTKKELVEKLINDANSCYSKLSQIEREEIKKK